MQTFAKSLAIDCLDDNEAKQQNGERVCKRQNSREDV
jgi:hypothetical protein